MVLCTLSLLVLRTVQVVGNDPFRAGTGTVDEDELAGVLLPLWEIDEATGLTTW